MSIPAQLTTPFTHWPTRVDSHVPTHSHPKGLFLLISHYLIYIRQVSTIRAVDRAPLALHEGNGPSHDINDQPVRKLQL